MAVTVAVESPLQDDVRGLVEALNAHLAPLSPLDYQFGIGVEAMAEPGMTVFVARDAAGQAVGCGALKAHDTTLGEVKRMFTRPEMRGQGVGRAMLDAIVDGAKRQGLSRIVLETGATEKFEPAWRLYETAGFSRCGAVLDYPDSGWSAFFERAL